MMTLNHLQHQKEKSEFQKKKKFQANRTLEAPRSGLGAANAFTPNAYFFWHAERC